MKKAAVNMSAAITAVIGLINIFFSYNYEFKNIHLKGSYYEFFALETSSINRVLSVIIGSVLVIVSYNLYKRMKVSWIITISMLSCLVFIHIMRFHNIFKLINLIQIADISILLFNYREFKKTSDPVSLKNALRIGSLIVLLIMINTGFTIKVLDLKYMNLSTMEGAVDSTIKMLFLINPGVLGSLSNAELIYVKSMIAINWSGIIFSLFLVLKPIVYQPIITSFDREKIRNLLRLYGDNPISYVSVEKDKKYFISSNVEGAIVYGIAAGVAVCVGDPLCSDEDMPILVTEFITFCKNNDIDICFCQTTEKHLKLYGELGFGITKYGEEAMFDLETYNLSGGKGAKIRNAVNKARTAGITAEEYLPLKGRDNHTEQEINIVSSEWLENKKSGELSFMLGSVSLDNPMDRRYFTAFDKTRRLLGFIVFAPFGGGKGYLADVTRRRGRAPIGVMELIMIEAFDKMKSEGLKWGSLGLAPLANASEDGSVAGRLLQFIYDKFNSFYGFKSLHHYKKKYSPTVWEPRYLVYYPKMITPKIVYAIMKVQNPKGVTDFVLSQLKNIFPKQ